LCVIDGPLAFILGSVCNHRFNMANFTMTETLGTPLASSGTEGRHTCNRRRTIDARVLTKLNYYYIFESNSCPDRCLKAALVSSESSSKGYHPRKQLSRRSTQYRVL